MEPRKGAIRRVDVPKEILAQLNSGELETATLAEALVVDFTVLLSRVAPELPAAEVAKITPGIGFTARMQAVGHMLVEQFGADGFSQFANHGSDTVRGWAGHMF